MALSHFKSLNLSSRENRMTLLESVISSPSCLRERGDAPHKGMLPCFLRPLPGLRCLAKAEIIQL